MYAVVGSTCPVTAECVAYPNRKRRIHSQFRIFWCQPLDGSCLVCCGYQLTTDLVAPIDEGNDILDLVQVSAGKALDLDINPGLFTYLARDAFLEGLPWFEDSTRRFPTPVVTALRYEHSSVVDNDTGDAHGERTLLVHNDYSATLDLSSRVEGLMERLGELDRTSDTPPFKQIADLLRAGIEHGRFAPGEKLPSESELMVQFNVARMTVRQAIAEIKGQGLAHSEHGRGVFVRNRPPVRRQANERFARRHRDAGKAAFLAESAGVGTPSVDELEVAEVAPADAVRQRLGLRKGTCVVRRSRRYLIDGEPVELAVTCIPAKIAHGTAMAATDTGPGGVYARIEESGHKLTSFTEEVTARMPSPEERRRLRLETGTPVLIVIRVAHSGDLPVETTETIKAAPRFVLEYSFPAD